MPNITIKHFFENLPGKWQLTREISSNMQAQGIAIFEPVNNNLIHYKETGIFDKTYSFSREYFYVLHEEKKLIKIFFNKELNNLFVKISDITDKNSFYSHLCDNDVYKYQIQYLNDKKFIAKCLVRGPKKNYTITTNFQKS